MLQLSQREFREVIFGSIGLGQEQEVLGFLCFFSWRGREVGRRGRGNRCIFQKILGSKKQKIWDLKECLFSKIRNFKARRFGVGIFLLFFFLGVSVFYRLVVRWQQYRIDTCRGRRDLFFFRGEEIFFRGFSRFVFFSVLVVIRL